MTRAYAASLAVCLAAAVFLGDGQIRSTSATFDEPVHLAAGYTDLVDGRYRLNSLDHPPLAEMWAALPLLALRPNVFPSHPAWAAGAVYAYGDLFLNQNRVGHERLLGAARTWSLVTLTALLLLLAAAWARRLGGDAAGLGAAFSVAFCVPWVSNAALVTTDALSAALFFAAFAVMSPSPRTRARWLAGGACAGLALAAKFNMILLPPLMLFALLGEAKTEKRAFDARSSALAAAAALAALLAVYRIGSVFLWWDGLSATLGRLAQGRPSYLMGRWGDRGWWWYFPLAMLVKTPIPLLLLGAGGAVLAARRRASEAVWLLLPPLGYLLASLTSKTQIGYRHVLPVYPFLCVWAGLALAKLRESKAGLAAAAALCAWLAASVLRVHPHHLAYFNEAAGGPARGGAWLADSNLDWGQDLKGLSAELAARGGPTVFLSYFGSDDPAAWGIRYVPVGMYGITARPGEPDGAFKGGPVLFALSETNRAAVYFSRKDVFAWLSERTPVARPGWSVALYDLTGDRDGRERLAALLEGAGRPGDAKAVRLHSRP